MGVDLAALADLPQDLRRRALNALAELEAAVKLGDPDASAKPTQELAAIIGEIQDTKAQAATNKLFGGQRIQGTRAVMETFAKRAGVRAA
jgi:phage-related protein